MRAPERQGRVVSLDRWRDDHATRTPLPLRLAPELDAFQILYRNGQHHNKLYALDIIGWTLLSDGTVDALVPWLDRIQLARTIADPLCGCWEGYYLAGADLVLDEPPPFKVQELISAADYFGLTECEGHVCPQALPDNSGTWALLFKPETRQIRLEPVARWLLTEDGLLTGELYADNGTTEDECLSLVDNPHFRYFLHETAVRQLMDGGEDAFSALADSLRH